MKFSALPLLAALAAAWPMTEAQAAISCSFNAGTGVSINYNSTTNNPSSGTFSVTCSRTLTTDPSVVNITAGNDDGLYISGNKKRAKLTTAANCTTASNCIIYELFTSSALSTVWSKNPKNITDTLTFATGALSATKVVTYYFTSAATQNVGVGSFTDLETLLPSYTSTPSSTVTGPPGSPAAFPVTISTAGFCSLSTPPGAITFSYVSFQPTAATASTGFAANCTTSLSYTMALSSTSGLLLGLPYALSLSATGGTGTGVAQSYTINGLIAGGLSGDCASASCNATAVHTLTITY